MLKTCSPSSYADTNTNGQRTSWLCARSCQSAVHAPIGWLIVCTLPVEARLEIEDAERRVLVLGLSDRESPVRSRRERVPAVECPPSR